MQSFNNYEEIFESLDFEICDSKKNLYNIMKISLITEIIILLSIPLSFIIPVTNLFLFNLISYGTIINASCNLINFIIIFTKYINSKKIFYDELESFKIFLKTNQLENHDYEKELDINLPYDDIAYNIEMIINDYNEMIRKNQEERELNLHPEKALEEKLPPKKIFGEKELIEHIHECIQEELDNEPIPVEKKEKKLNLKKNH